MFLVTGDCHQQYGKILDCIEKLNLGERDTILVLGDMGLFWRKDGSDADNFIKYYEDNYNCNLWFIDGNHENFDLLKQVPIVNGIGGISLHIKWIKRGTILTIEGKRCLFMRRR